MIKTIENFLKTYNIFNQNVIIGFSAGPDSCALALILNKLKKKYKLNIILAYFNHGWRKLEAKQEEEFTKKFAKKYDCNFIIGSAPKNSKKTEEYARIYRYDFFEKISKDLNSNVVFLAHNKNDNIETLIYRIVKGTSISGLTSIPKVRDIYYRPLLTIEKAQILDFLKINNEKYMIDSSNNDEIHLRNLIRSKILPQFAKINPNYFDSIQNLIENAVSAKQIVDNSINTIEKEIIKNNKIDREKFIELDMVYRLEILNNFFYDKLKYRTRANLIKLDKFILENKNSKTSLNKDEFLVVKNNKIYIEKIEPTSDFKLDIFSEGVYQFETLKIEIKRVKTPSKFPKDNEKKCYLSFDFPVTVRHRTAGDKFSPYGLKGSMKLKDYLINEKYEQSQKNKLVLLCKDSEVCWIVGKKISEKFKAKNDMCYKIELI